MSTPVLDATKLEVPGVEQQAGMLLHQIAGYVGTRTTQLGLRAGLIETLAEVDHGLTPAELAVEVDIDPFYAEVWCRAAIGAGLLVRDGERLRLAAHLDALLLEGEHPAHVGAMVRILEHPEIFDRFGERLATGERTWWDQCSGDFIAGVAATGLPFYVRLIPGGLSRVPGVEHLLRGPARVLDTACGSGAGLVRLGEKYPDVTLAGTDGDRWSLDRAAEAVAAAGLEERADLVHTPLEELDHDEEFDLVINNISMHECRDIDEVTARIRRSLRPGGWFVISDFPFPADDEGLTCVPGRIMSAIQFFEAQIDDQLLPRHAYDDLLERHGFTNLGSAELAPVHALTWGQKAR
jgi:ubiquinone/menaquinone biosynthesis C-methylase UbiE